MIKIVVAEHLGMCFGVRDAIAQAESLAQKGPLTILGQLVHNPVVRQRLRNLGVEEQSAATGSAIHSGRVMITAHGVSDLARKNLNALGVDLADGTCPLVRQAHMHLRQLVRDGYFPVVIGLAGHVEVRGLTEDFADVSVINVSGDVARLPHLARFGIVSQTTQPIDRVLCLVDEIRRARPSAEVRFVDTVCKPTKDRQHALRKLLQSADTIVVVGGRESNNTRELVQTCLDAGRRAIHIQRAEELNVADFVTARIVGVTAGTSTLPETVSAVIEQLNRIALKT